MGAMTNILVKDDTATPVEFTLKPVSDTPVPFWRTAVSGTPLEGQIRLYASEETLKDGSIKVSVKLEVPVMETLGASGTAAGYVAPPKVAYVNRSWHTFNFDKRSTQADRANTLRLAVGIMQGATSSTATGTLANNAAGDVWKASTAPLVNFVVNLEAPN